jgi:hypothetical protein
MEWWISTTSLLNPLDLSAHQDPKRVTGADINLSVLESPEPTKV